MGGDGGQGSLSGRPQVAVVVDWGALSQQSEYFAGDGSFEQPQNLLFGAAEVLGLAWSAVDFDAGTVSVAQGRVVVRGAGTTTGAPKSERSRRTLPMPADVMAALRTLNAQQKRERLALGPTWIDPGLIAIDEDGSPIRPETYSKAFRRHCTAAGVPVIRLHDTRHTAATRMLDSGTTVSATAKWLGHDPAMTLRVYGHVYEDALASAGDVLLGGMSRANGKR